VHKTANVLDKMPKSVQGEAKSMLHEMWGPLHGLRHLADVITDVRFINGVNEKETGREAAELMTAIHNISETHD